MGKQSHKAMPFMCGACKSGFGSEKSLIDHIRNSHSAIHSCGLYRCIARVDGPECEPRYGIEASPPTVGMRRADAFADMLDALRQAQQVLSAFDLEHSGQYVSVTAAIAKAEAR